MHKYCIIISCCMLVFVAACKSQDPYQPIPVTIADNRPFVQAVINGDTLHLGIDCGAVNLLDSTVAAGMVLPKRDAFQQNGPGGRRADAYYTTVASLELGKDLRFSQQTFVVVSLKEIKDSLRLPYLDGLIGYNLFRDSIIEIDYAKGSFRFLPAFPEGKQYTNFVLYRNQVPMIKASLQGITGSFILDTGDRSFLSLNPEFAARAGLYEKFKLSEPHVTGYGIGGAIHARTFTLPEFTYAGITAIDIHTRIPEASAGFLNDTTIAGSIGSGLLQHRKLVLDYRNKWMLIE